MSTRVSPIETIRGEIDDLFAGGRDLVEVIEDVARLGARLIIQTALEAEVDAFLGRARYQRAATGAGDENAAAPVRSGHRNGHRPTTVKTTAGPMTVHRPKLRGTTEAFDGACQPVNDVGKPCAGELHARFEAAGTGNGASATAPVPDPTQGQM